MNYEMAIAQFEKYCNELTTAIDKCINSSFIDLTKGDVDDFLDRGITLIHHFYRDQADSEGNVPYSHGLVDVYNRTQRYTYSHERAKRMRNYVQNNILVSLRLKQDGFDDDEKLRKANDEISSCRAALDEQVAITNSLIEDKRFMTGLFNQTNEENEKLEAELKIIKAIQTDTETVKSLNIANESLRVLQQETERVKGQWDNTLMNYQNVQFENGTLRADIGSFQYQITQLNRKVSEYAGKVESFKEYSKQLEASEKTTKQWSGITSVVALSVANGILWGFAGITHNNAFSITLQAAILCWLYVYLKRPAVKRFEEIMLIAVAAFALLVTILITS